MLDALKDLFAPLRRQPLSRLAALQPTLKDLLARIHLHARLNPEATVRRFDDELTAGLSQLAVELRSLLARPGAAGRGSGLAAAAQPALEHIDATLSADTQFRDIEPLETALLDLLRTLEDTDARGRRRKRWLARAALVAGAGPVLGYALHWGLGHYYSAALLEHVGFVYPDTRFERTEDGYYRARYEDLRPALKRFEDQYFATTRGTPLQPVSLPSIYDDDVAREWGAAKPDKPTNLFVERVFVRSIRDAHAIDKIGVRVRRVADSAFYWHRFDLSTDVDLAAQRNTVVVHTTRTPVKSVRLSFAPVTLLGERVHPGAKGPDHVITRQAYRPTFGEHDVITRADLPLYFRFPQGSAPAGPMNGAVELRVAPPRDERQWFALSRRIEATLQRARGPVTIPCTDGGRVIVVGNVDVLPRVVSTETLDALTATADYALLDGSEASTEAALHFDTPFLFMDERHRGEPTVLATCLGLEESAMPQFRASQETAARQSAAERIIQIADLASRALASDLRVQGGEIVLEEEFYFDLAREPAPRTEFKRSARILRDGDFVVFNVVLMSYPSGIYQFDFLFNDEPVANVEVDPLWPQSLRYKPADDRLFLGPGAAPE